MVFTKRQQGNMGYHEVQEFFNRKNLVNKKISILFVELLTGCSQKYARHAVNVRKRQKCSFLSSSIAGLRYSLRALFGTLRTYFRERLKMSEINFNGIEWHFTAVLPLVPFLLVAEGECVGGCLIGISGPSRKFELSAPQEII